MNQKQVPSSTKNEKEEPVKLWLPTAPKISEIMEANLTAETKLDKLALYYLLHHFKPERGDDGKVKYRYILTYQAKCLFKINAQEHLSFLVTHGIIQHIPNPDLTYFRLTEPFTEGKYFTLDISIASFDRIKKFERIPTKFIEENVAMSWYIPW